MRTTIRWRQQNNESFHCSSSVGALNSSSHCQSSPKTCKHGCSNGCVGSACCKHNSSQILVNHGESRPLLCTHPHIHLLPPPCCAWNWSLLIPFTNSTQVTSPPRAAHGQRSVWERSVRRKTSAVWTCSQTRIISMHAVQWCLVVQSLRIYFGRVDRVGEAGGT